MDVSKAGKLECPMEQTADSLKEKQWDTTTDRRTVDWKDCCWDIDSASEKAVEMVWRLVS